jgi:hypothetical protein
VDISVTRVEQANPLLLKEVIASTGSTACGAMRVDDAYIDLLRDIMGPVWTAAVDAGTLTALETKWLDAKVIAWHTLSIAYTLSTRSTTPLTWLCAAPSV